MSDLERPMTAPRLVELTPAQRAVVGELARDGADNATIAARLGCSEATVKTHVKHAMARIGVTNRAALVCALLRREVVIRTVNKAGHHFRKDAA